ncbi:hypothetical protein CDL15_Pgr023207 [Punica granatum]|uniref:EamA domain-containing protein n=2 Tax=Punica granatum TaxID=22663 RepID=A0A218X3H6_PUNGR|nr:hypothetical protein CDL15_Pgr023207 [Punica granatum]
MASPEPGDRDPSVELVVCDVPAPAPAGTDSGGGGGASEEIAPLLSQSAKPKINIFTLSYPRRKAREQVIRSQETEGSPFLHFVSLLWSGSRYSGLLCMVVSSAFYLLMEIISDAFSVQPIPLYETVFARSTIILILSCSWLRRSGQPIFEPRHEFNEYFHLGFLLGSEAKGFVTATVLSFTTPIMASIAARIMLNEKLRIGEIGGGLSKAGELSVVYFQGSHHIYAVLVGIFAAITGGISYCCIRAASRESSQPIIQRLPLSQATVLSFTTPIMASIAARIMLNEKLRIGEIGGLACSFFGLLFIFQPTLIRQGGLSKAGELSVVYFQGSHHIYAVLVGIFAAITGGISYCCIRAASRESSQPMSSLFSFSLLAAPAAAICTFLFEVFVLPGIYSLFIMVMLGLLAFFAELLLARALQLEKTSKAANVQFIEVAFLQLRGIGLRLVAPSFGHLVGCLLILISAGYTIYAGPDKETG